jgi:hypothetical protein
MKPTFTNHLQSLLLGSALAVSAVPQVQAAFAPSANSSIASRVEKIRQAASSLPADIVPGVGTDEEADLLWWRNAWGNGGWHNWHNGWRNGGGWHNWLNL